MTLRTLLLVFLLMPRFNIDKEPLVCTQALRTKVYGMQTLETPEPIGSFCIKHDGTKYLKLNKRITS